MKTLVFTTLVITAIALSDASVLAQARGGGGGRGVVLVDPGAGFKITESAPIEVTTVKDAPFAAQAVTEFTQTLGDGNRIERRYQSSVARDSRGRTRREEEIALIGPLAAASTGTTRLVTIVDPDSAASYTLDEDQRVAYRSRSARKSELTEMLKLIEAAKSKSAITAKSASGRGMPAEIKKAEIDLAQINGADPSATQDLGVRTIEGVRAQGTRVTTTIPAGAIGNLMPIEIVSERWFSPELQMPVLITRRDPRNGDTTYRLTNIQRGEQPELQFTVPSGYEVKEGDLKFKLIEKASEKTKSFEWKLRQ
jgi:hypothetical protein